MRAGRALGWSLAGLILLAVTAAGTLHWASRSETVLRWAVEVLARRLPGSLTVEGLQGAVLAPVRIARLVYETDTLRLEARDLSLEWSPLLLRHERLEIERLRIARLDIRTKPVEPERAAAPPEHLRLPLQARVHTLQVDVLTVGNAARTASLRDIIVAYEGGAEQHSLKLQRLHSEWGNAAGALQMSAQAPFGLNAKLSVSTEYVAHWPGSAAIELSGQLTDLRAQASAQVRGIEIDAQARIAPFDATPLETFTASATQVSLGEFIAGAPPAQLDVTVSGTQADERVLTGTVQIRNRTPGRLERGALPVHALAARYAAREQRVDLTDLDIGLGAAGRLAGSATLQPGALELALETAALNLRELHGQLLATRLAGTIGATAQAQRQHVRARLSDKGIAMDVDASHADGVVTVRQLAARSGPARLDASGTLGLSAAYPFTARGRLTRFDPSRFGDFPAASVNATLDASGELRPTWSARLRYAIDESRLRGAALRGRGTLALQPGRVHGADGSLLWAGNRIELRGAFGAAGDRLQVRIDAPRLGALGLPVQGSVQASGAIGGSLRQPSADLTVQARSLQAQGYAVQHVNGHVRVQASNDPALDISLQAREITGSPLPLSAASLQVRGAMSRHVIDLAAQGDEVAFTALLEGAWRQTDRRWSGQLQRLRNQGRYPFALLAPTPLALGRDAVELGAARVEFAGGQIELGATRYGAGRLVSEGAFTGVPLARVLALARRPLELQSSLVLGGRWSIDAGDRVAGDVQIYREQGDLALPGDRPLPLQLTELRLSLQARDSRLTGSGRVAGGRLGRASADFETRLTRRDARWGLAGSAPLRLTAQADIDSLRPVAALVSRRALIDGRIAMRMEGNGTVAEPRLQGSVEGDALRLEQAGYGLFLRDGTLRARFAPRALELTEFTMHGGQGRFSATGRLSARGRQLSAELDWQAERLAAVTQPDLRLVLSGQGKVEADGKRVRLQGRVTADQGRVELRERSSVRLGDDVVVVGEQTQERGTMQGMREEIDLLADLGQDFRVSGRGINARLVGQVRVTSTPEGALRGEGQIAVAEGMYEAYGQRLVIDKGILYFAGPLDNPGIEIRAMRKNQQVEAGVELTGTARDPRARLVSTPDVPDPEKLSWLLYGRGVPQTGNQEYTQQAYALALAASINAIPLQDDLARAVGIDEIRFASSSGGAGTETAGVISFGKQLSDRIYLIYERGLTGATNAVKINYQFAQDWSLRTESGTTNAVDVFYTISFD